MIKLRTCFFVAIFLFSIFDLAISKSLDDISQMGKDEYNEEKNKPVNLPPQNSSYDFIIVGAGPAGCVLANRLSANPNWTVYLIEAGATENIVSDFPAMAINLQMTEANWKYKSTPQKKACQGMRGNICNLPRGKLLGGTSGINLMMYTRGNRQDFDEIAEAGNYGWSYEEVLPYFKKSEKANLIGLENSPYHNRSGLLSVEYVKYRTIMANAFVDASVELGYPLVDYNGESQYGTSYIQATTENGHRHSAAKAFIFPIINERKNLHVLTFATVTKILIDKATKSAYGVDFVHRGINYTIKAKKEVILSAGTFNSPQLLMLSGIGPKHVLESVGVNQLLEAPVGKIMYEHMSHYGPVYTTNSTGATFFTDRVTSDDINRFQAGDPSTRVSTIGSIEALTYIQLPGVHHDNDRPDIELELLSCSLASDYGKGLKEAANFKDEVYTTVFKPLEGIEHLTFDVMPLRPISTGNLYLNNSNPFTPPIIEPNYFEKEEDIEVMLAGIKEAIRIAEQPAMKKINATLHTIKVPGCEGYTFGTDDYWRCSIGVMSYTVHHQVASCKMGTLDDSTAVVSPQLKVYGIKKLRVVDTSIIPTPPSAHTNALSFMIGEKAADMIIEEWTNMLLNNE